jgi:signal transduction histidine kinase
VEDNGIGIPPADRPYIFDKFYRVKTAETDDIVGTGLGLSIVKSIIEKHHGRIWVRSQLGVGTTFTFMLPAASEPAASKP